MADRQYHSLEFVPRRSDPEKRWALSVKQPLAALVATGRTELVTSSKAPPPEMIGRRIALHAGAGHVPYKEFTEDSRAWAEKAFGNDLPALRHLLPHGGVIATVVLASAYRIGRVIHGKAYADPKRRYAADYAGTWHGHDGKRIFETGELSGRWVWALTEPRLCPDFVPLRGYGGIFDLEGARELERWRRAGEGRHAV